MKNYLSNTLEVFTISVMFFLLWIIIFAVHSVLPNPYTWNMGMM